MKIALWVSGKLNGQALIHWATAQGHEVKCLASLEPKEKKLAWATDNIDALKKVSDTNKIDLLFMPVKKSGEENHSALDTLLAFAKDKYKLEAVAVASAPEIAHPIRNAAKKLKLKTVLLPK
ncbi:MAG TPA: hypothetical protein VLJ21_00775 [Candidatus Binatia bacterium]|nr:hypothetical protein [Candidatus Binatia bacterium]